jgi:hypothetical protein
VWYFVEVLYLGYVVDIKLCCSSFLAWQFFIDVEHEVLELSVACCGTYASDAADRRA